MSLGVFDPIVEANPIGHIFLFESVMIHFNQYPEETRLNDTDFFQ